MLSKLLTYFLSIPKSIYFNLKYFDFRTAIRLPVLVSYNTKYKELKGDINIPEEIKFGMIKIGFGDVGIFDKAKRRTHLQITGNINFDGIASIGHGSSLSVSGNLNIGDNFTVTAESKIICKKHICFGKNCLISWDCLIMDTDFHSIYDLNNNINMNEDREIIIGDNVWIGCRNIILKGAEINNNSVISAQSKVISKFNKENVIISGNPAQIIRENIYWKV